MSTNMITFTILSPVDNLHDILISTFDMALPLEGGWGYTQDTATMMTAVDIMPKSQIEHT